MDLRLNTRIRLVTFFILFTASNVMTGQTDTLHIHYFPDGKVSTFSYIEESKLKGKAFAYDFDGRVIYERETRRLFGSAGVNFTHHKNGMVHKAHYSSHPGGGIQWFETQTVFNDQGEKILEKDQHHDPLRLKPNVVFRDTSTVREEPKEKRRKPSDEVKKKPKRYFEEKQKEYVQCASIHSNRTKVINHTRFNIEVTFIYQNKDMVKKLRPGEKMDGPTYITAEISGLPDKNLTFRFIASRKRKKVRKLVYTVQNEQYKTTHTIHLFESTAKLERDKK